MAKSSGGGHAEPRSWNGVRMVLVVGDASAWARIDSPSRNNSSMGVGMILRSSYLDHPIWDGVGPTETRSFKVTPVPGSVEYMSSGIV